MYSDMLMPAINKRPMFSHKRSCWSWELFSSFKESRPYHEDFGVLLKTLCVIDVDTVEQVLEVENKFPYLLKVPTEKTLSGKHYWFLRSELADMDGYFDGPGQVVRGIDFKSICANGTSGFIVIGPSTNKTWIRPLYKAIFEPGGNNDITSIANTKYNSILIPIPNELLNFVARPKKTNPLRNFYCGTSTIRDREEIADTQRITHMISLERDSRKCKNKIKLVFTSKHEVFGDHSEQQEKCIFLYVDDPNVDHVLGRMSYFDLFLHSDSLLDNESSGDIPVPCSFESFVAIRNMIVFGELCVNDILECEPANIFNHMQFKMSLLLSDADKLGLHFDFMRQLRVHAIEAIDICNKSHTMWIAINNERYWRHHRSKMADDDNVLVDVLDDYWECDTFSTKQYVATNSDWLFGGLDLEEPKTCTSSKNGTHGISSLPYEVLYLLKRYGRHLVLAGGAAFGLVANNEIKDFDLFLVDVDDARASQILCEIYSIFSLEEFPKHTGLSINVEGLKSIVTDHFMDKLMSSNSITRINTHLYTILLTKHALTILGKETGLIIQVILRVYESHAHVVLGFDIAPSRICMYFDMKDVVECTDMSILSKHMRIRCTPSWLESMRGGFFPVEITFWGQGSILRVLKYMKKGFNSFVPGARRSHMIRKCKNTQFEDLECRVKCGRLDGLFAAEALIIQGRYTNNRVDMSDTDRCNSGIPIIMKHDFLKFFDPSICKMLSDLALSNSQLHFIKQPLTSFELCRITNISVATNDYDIVSKVARRMQLMFRKIKTSAQSLVNHNMVFKGIKLVSLDDFTKDIKASNKRCAHTFRKANRMGMFYPIDPSYDEVFNSYFYQQYIM